MNFRHLLGYDTIVNVLSISEMIKSIFAVQGATADCQLASFSYFYLVIVFTAGQYN